MSTCFTPSCHAVPPSALAPASPPASAVGNFWICAVSKFSSNSGVAARLTCPRKSTDHTLSMQSQQTEPINCGGGAMRTTSADERSKNARILALSERYFGIEYSLDRVLTAWCQHLVSSSVTTYCCPLPAGQQPRAPPRGPVAARRAGAFVPGSEGHGRVSSRRGRPLAGNLSPRFRSTPNQRHAKL